MTGDLPELALERWEPTKETLHLWGQIVGKVRMPNFYSYTSPEPAGLAEQPLRPEAASWQPTGSSHLALLPYDEVRSSLDPRGTLLEFLQTAYDAGATTAGWDADGLRSNWCPPVTLFDQRPGRDGGAGQPPTRR